ncbi:ASCH domain-containing protein [Maribacter sp. 1_2014MBL_MicDiv]|uniref:ASCH domain-containing protein n=1 Tax=Maribacter sp. 1_2014MBL_MicDiv TaxID=1644130 RepID=UPI0018DD3590|nr:ASCH domain-containing protein [Maribacter sp. 1_2014MBL_MicDiv]
MDSIDGNLLLISIKPKFAESIFNGEKTIELRKSAPTRAGKNSYMLIYVTAPVKKVWGICRIESIIKETPNRLWEKHGQKTGITKSEFNDYYKENKKAFGIEIADVINFSENSVDLKNLKNYFPGFSPPQSYGYLNKELISNSPLKKLIS